MMRGTVLIVSLLYVLLPHQADALRVMADDRVIGSQEGRFMAGAEWWLPAIGLIMFLALGAVQWGVPHLLFRLSGRYCPRLNMRQRASISLCGFLVIWLLFVLVFFHANGNVLMHLGYVVFTLCGYLTLCVPTLLARTLKRKWPALTRWQHRGLVVAALPAIIVALYFLLRLMTIGRPF